MKVRVCALIEQGNKVLVLAYDYPGGRVYAIPGGTVEEGETVEECLVREFEEELGIHVRTGTLRYVADMLPHHQLDHTVHLIFEADLLSGTPKTDARHTSAVECLWLALDSIGDIALYPAINTAIEEDRREKQNRPRYLGPCQARSWA